MIIKRSQQLTVLETIPCHGNSIRRTLMVILNQLATMLLHPPLGPVSITFNMKLEGLHLLVENTHVNLLSLSGHHHQEGSRLC